LTDFKDQLIFDFAWSRDGEYLALSRGTVNSDVVLIRNFRWDRHSINYGHLYGHLNDACFLLRTH